MAALDFPASPSVGQLYPAPPVAGVPVYKWDGEKWTTLGGALGSTGASDAIPQQDTGSGAAGSSTLWTRGDHAHPTDTSKVSKGGDTMTGHLSLPTGPAAANAVRKDYVDAAVAAIPVAATAAEYVSNSAPTKMLTPGAAWTAAAPVALTDGATVTPDFTAGLDFLWTLGAAGRTLANPSAGVKPGQKGIFYLTQDGTGSRTITTWGSSYKFSGGTKPTLSTAANAIDTISYAVKSVTEIHCVFLAGMA